MVYLNKGLFKHVTIVASIILLPLIIAALIATVCDFEIEIFVTLTVMVLIYVLSIWGSYKYSKSRRYHISKDESGFITIHYPDIPNTLACGDIVKIKYYKSSVKNWFWYITGMNVCPYSVFITYTYQGKEACKPIGYPDYKEICKLCDELNISFVKE